MSKQVWRRMQANATQKDDPKPYATILSKYVWL